MTTSSPGPSAPTSEGTPTWADGLAVATNALADAVFDGALPAADRDGARARVRAHDLCHSLDGEGPRTAISVAAPTGAADWLAAWERALEAAAVTVDPSPDRPDPGAVAVVGLRLDRREADRTADAAEVRRILEALDLPVAAVWPGEGGVADLARVARAGTLVALPYGRRAAAALAGRTGARVVDAGLPLGIAGTTAWIRAVAVATGREDRAEAFVDRELDFLVPRFEWAVPNSLLHRRIALGGDGPFVAALAGMLLELGVDVAGVEAVGGEAPAGFPAIPWSRKALDLVVGPRPTVERAIAAEVPSLELGFPSPGAHSLAPAPHLGYAGVPHLVEAIINRLALWDTLKSWEKTTVGEVRPVRRTPATA